MKKMPLHTKIILGLILGLVVGVSSVFMGIGGLISDWVMPFGTIFVKMLKLVAVPLIFVSLVAGISNLRDTAKLSRIGGKTFGIYILTTVTAIIIALFLANTLQPGKYFPEEKTGFIESARDRNSNGKKKFFNLGPGNDWSKLLDNDVRLEIEEKFKNEMLELGYL